MKGDLINSFIEKWLDLDIQLREKGGLNDGLYEELIALLQLIEAQLRGQDTVPKDLAGIFVDMGSAMMSCADTYDEDERQAIYEAADKLMDSARTICCG